MAHNSHPHGEKLVKPHQVNDRLSTSKNDKVSGLPDSKRETWYESDPYPNSMNPYPPDSKKITGNTKYNKG